MTTGLTVFRRPSPTPFQNIRYWQFTAVYSRQRTSLFRVIHFNNWASRLGQNWNANTSLIYSDTHYTLFGWTPGIDWQLRSIIMTIRPRRLPVWRNTSMSGCINGRRASSHRNCRSGVKRARVPDALGPVQIARSRSDGTRGAAITRAPAVSNGRRDPQQWRPADAYTSNSATGIIARPQRVGTCSVEVTGRSRQAGIGDPVDTVAFVGNFDRRNRAKTKRVIAWRVLRLRVLLPACRRVRSATTKQMLSCCRRFHFKKFSPETNWIWREGRWKFYHKHSQSSFKKTSKTPSFTRRNIVCFNENEQKISSLFHHI